MRKRMRNNKPLLKKTAEECAEFLRSPHHRVLFFDEGRFGLKPTLGRAWAKRGRSTPLVPVQPGYQNFYLYSAVDPLSGSHFTLLLPWVNTLLMNFYLEKLAAAYPNETLWIIMDQAGWHMSGDLFVPPSIRLIYLPPYSPELNPVERLWRWLRRSACRNRLFRSLTEVEDACCNSLNSLCAQSLSSLCNCSYLHIKN
jgi:transposase